MSEGLQAFFAATPWAPIAIAFLVGFACGWLIWGLRGVAPEGAAALSESQPGEAERKEIIALRAELEAARTLLVEADAHDEDVAGQLSAVDDALKRANGRLKVIQRGLSR